MTKFHDPLALYTGAEYDTINYVNGDFGAIGDRTQNFDDILIKGEAITAQERQHVEADSNLPLQDIYDYTETGATSPYAKKEETVANDKATTEEAKPASDAASEEPTSFAAAAPKKSRKTTTTEEK